MIKNKNFLELPQVVSIKQLTMFAIRSSKQIPPPLPRSIALRPRMLPCREPLSRRWVVFCFQNPPPNQFLPQLRSGIKLNRIHSRLRSGTDVHRQVVNIDTILRRCAQHLCRRQKSTAVRLPIACLKAQGRLVEQFNHRIMPANIVPMQRIRIREHPD